MASEVHVPSSTIHMMAANKSVQWAPIWIKLSVTSVLQHVGGIHSGCALSGAGYETSHRLENATDRLFSWLIYKIVDIIRHRAVQNSSVIATGVITNTLVVISVLSAFPWVRK